MWIQSMDLHPPKKKKKGKRKKKPHKNKLNKTKFSTC